VYDKVFYSITAREIILEWDKTACRFVFSYWTWTWTWTWTCPFKVDLDLDLRIGDLDLVVAGLVTSLVGIDFRVRVCIWVRVSIFQRFMWQ